MPYKLTIGLKLKKKREELDLTVENIVSITGVSKGSVYRVESGTAEDIDFYVKYAIAVKYPLKELMDVDLSTVINTTIFKSFFTHLNILLSIHHIHEFCYFAKSKRRGKSKLCFI